MYRNLQKLLESKGISVETLAKLLGIHRNTVTSKLNGESEFTFSQAETIIDNLLPEYTFKYVFKREAPAAA